MDDLSSIGQLSNLEILSFDDCRIKNLPSAVGKLRRLKLLDLTGCGELCIGDGVFQNLDDLEELYMSNVGFTEDNCEGLEMVSKKLTALEVQFFGNNIRPNNVSFKNLERFRISIGCGVDDTLYVYHSGVDDEPYENQNELFEKTLRLVASCEEVCASEINELFEKTEKLHLQVEDMNHLEDVLMHPFDQYSFCNLKYLSFEKCANLKYLFTVKVASTLTNLEKLIVECCDVLGSLIHDENNGAEVITFHKLRLLKLKELPEFVGLCDNINIVMQLPQLVMLSLSDIPNITCIFDSSNNISATTIPLLNKKVVYPKLKILSISSMKNLKEIWACEEEYDRTPVLKEISVYKCDDIQNLFPRNPMRLLSHLEKLTVWHCGSIQALFDIDSECVGQVNSSLRSIRARHLGKLREVWRIRGEDNSGLYVRDFQALESIKIDGCKNFRNIVTPTTIKFDMGALTDIIIEWSGGSDEENEISEVDDSRVLFSSVHTLHHVSSIRFDGLKHVEVIFDIQIPSVGSVKPNDDEHGEQTTTTSKAVKLPKLRDVNLEYLASLKYIWKSNVQTVLEFPSLTKLSIDSCNKLEHVFTCSMVGSLLQLKELSVSSCLDMEVIVKEDQEEEGGDGKVNEIRLPCLKYLKLKGLDSLKGFCLGNVDYSLPSLEHMKIKGCKSLTIFTKGRWCVPEIKLIKTSLGDINLAEEQDINSFIITKKQEGFHFGYQD